MPNNMADRSIYFFFFTETFIVSWLVVSKGPWVYTKGRHVSQSGLNPGHIGERRVLSHHCDSLRPNELMGNKIVYLWRNMKKLYDSLRPNELMGNKIVYLWRNMKKLFRLHIWKNYRKIIVGVCYGITSIRYSCQLLVGAVWKRSVVQLSQTTGNLV